MSHAYTHSLPTRDSLSTRLYLRQADQHVFQVVQRIRQEELGREAQRSCCVLNGLRTHQAVVDSEEKMKMLVRYLNDEHPLEGEYTRFIRRTITHCNWWTCPLVVECRLSKTKTRHLPPTHGEWIVKMLDHNINAIMLLTFIFNIYWTGGVWADGKQVPNGTGVPCDDDNPCLSFAHDHSWHTTCGIDCGTKLPNYLCEYEMPPWCGPSIGVPRTMSRGDTCTWTTALSTPLLPALGTPLPLMTDVILWLLFVK